MKRDLLFTISALLLILILSACVASQQSPDSKRKILNCLDCHPQLATTLLAGNVHRPVKDKNCGICHLPHGLIGGIQLRTLAPKLCLNCHKTINASSAQVTVVHEPFKKGSCLSCHSSHSSEFDNLLNKSPLELCYTCHGLEQFTKKYIHGPVAQGCSACHQAHFSGPYSLLHDQEQLLCAQCHQTSEPGFVNKHFGYTVASSKCTQCHDPHSSDTPSLLKTVSHPPSFSGDCQTCHASKKDLKKLVAAKNTLCGKCHSQDAFSHMHTPYISKQCLDCHAPHASEHDYMLKKSSRTLCFTCHDSYKKVKKGHRPVVTGECIACHSGHGSKRPYYLKGDEQAICLECHKEVFKTVQKHSPVAQKQCLSCHLPHESSLPSLLRKSEGILCGACHTDILLENNKASLHRPFADGQCSSCHTPHGGKINFLKESEKSGALCLTCHQDGSQSIKRPHKPFSEGKCTLCHDPHAGNYVNLGKTTTEKNCLSCHGDLITRQSSQRVQHQPFRNGECAECHAPHGSNNEYHLKAPKLTLCVSCHASVIADWTDGKPHQPAAENCMNCHSSHSSAVTGLLNTTVGKLCSECHQMNADELQSRHAGIQPGDNSCNACHDPHGSRQEGMLFGVSHEPFTQKQCMKCHDDLIGKFNHLDSSAQSLCFSCHSRNILAGGIVHAPVKDGKCTVCHNVHAAPYQKLTKQSTGKLCVGCHPSDTPQTVVQHDPYEKRQCIKCHDAHSSDTKGLVPNNMAAVCFECHQGSEREYAYAHKPFAQGQCARCHNAHGSAEAQLLNASADVLCMDCHRTIGDGKGHLYNSSIKNCLSCHNPHGSANKFLIRNVVHPPFKKDCARCHHSKKFATSELCFGCHLNVKDDRKFLHNHLTDSKTMTCTVCHSPHAGDDSFLLRGSQKVICRSCHSDTFREHANSISKHSKIDRCTDCHNGHGSDGPAMIKGDSIALCSSCHASHGEFSHPIGEKVKDPRNSQPMTCITCHDPKGTAYPYQLKLDGEKALCVQCHNY